MFVTYDQSGMITATIIGPGAEYADLLDAAGKRWLFLPGVTSLDPILNKVDVERRAVVRRLPGLTFDTGFAGEVRK